MNSVICLVGPTGTGKSAFSLLIGEVLKKQGLEIAVVNSDSRQVYKDFPIVTAQPTSNEYELFPHYFYGYLESVEKISAGQWAEKAYSCIETLLNQKKIPIIVGGTGFYLRALLDGISKIPEIPIELHKKYENFLVSNGNAPLYEKLCSLDPEYALKIHRNDSHRTMRALEVLEYTSKTFTWWHNQTPPPPALRVIRIGIGLPLSELTPILNERIKKMIRLGAVEEVAKALKKCPDLSAPAWSGIGCSDIINMLSGECTLEESIINWTQKTRDYAKRQLTWFKADKRIVWYRPEEQASILNTAVQFILDE